MKKGGGIYIMTNYSNTVLYTGVTNDLIRRVTDHKDGKNLNSFTYRYNLKKLVYFESFHTIEEAIAKEKQIKGGSRKKKENLINSLNPEWKDLWEEILKW
ncbi:GIY-YIG nuclease family protein [Algoriphagus sanaruensis]|uniref:Excinuclease ABC subunit C n=1 Tax=Algoriphagus sanaruensis TaxID=1727163 RepID=A0A142EQW2_9BACT|nr:GIY-YIG nuclease family protein [Algoriphagus sanaruensis]AMQ57517.1 excinuclease ABC subunit C [Algoriphagus sanaruensis]